MDHQRVTAQQLRVGEPLPWDVYDGTGMLLLRRGELVGSERALLRFLESGLFVRHADFVQRGDWVSPLDEPSALQMVMDARRLLAKIYEQPPGAITEFPSRIGRVAELIEKACELEATVCLASILLMQQTVYTVRHPVDVAILSRILAQEIGLDKAKTTTVVHAALTMNIGMYEVQEKINAISGPLNEKLSSMIRRHPALGVERLGVLGISDALWLNLVMQHHENTDGSGYPCGLNGDALDMGSKLIGFADKYCAMVSSRSYRGPQRPHTALRDLCIKQGQKIDITVAGTMIRLVSVYPPGTLVRLKTGEIGVVTGPGNGPDTPAVHAIIGRSGTSLEVASYRKTHLADTAIEDVLTVDKLSAPVRLSSIWGKRAVLR